MDTTTIFLNGAAGRQVSSEQEVEETCRHLADLSSFWLTVQRRDGVQFDVAADSCGATAFYLDIGRTMKLTSLGPFVSDSEVVRMVVEDFPEMDLEYERRHLVFREDALRMLRQFLVGEVPTGMVPWPD